MRHLGSDPVAQVRRIRLHVGTGIESDAWPRHRPAGRSRRDRGPWRDRRDHGGRAPPRHSRDLSSRRDPVDPDHHAGRDRGASARPRHSRHATLTGEHPWRTDHHRGEIARRDPQGRGTSAAHRCRRLLRTDHAQGTDGDGHAWPRCGIGNRHGRRRCTGRGIYDRAGYADRQSDRAGHQDHRQCPDRPAHGRQHRPGRQRDHGRDRDARRGDRAPVRRGAARSPRDGTRRRKRSATANSRFIAAIPRFSTGRPVREPS